MVRIVLAVAGTSVTTAVALAGLLPAVAAVGPELGGSWPAPLLGGLAVSLWLAARRDDGRALGDLSGKLAAVYAGVSLVALAVLELLGLDPVTAARPWAGLVVAPVLITTMAMAMRGLIHRRLQAEAEARPSVAPGDQPRQLFPVHAVRPTLTVTALAFAAVSCGVLGVHLHSRASADAEQLAARRTAELTRLARAVARRLDPAGLERWLASQPAAAERLVLGQRATDAQRLLLRLADGRALLLDPRPVSGGELGLLLLLLSLALVAGAGLLARAHGSDVQTDLRAVTEQVAAMSEEMQLDRPLVVGSADEVGELAAAVGRLRRALQRELSSFVASRRLSEEADARKARFLGDVSHELRMPLSNILGFCQTLLAGLHGELSAQQRDDVEVVHRSGHELLELVNDVLDISAIDAGELVLECAPLDVGQLARVLTESQQAVVAAGGGRVSLRCEVAEALPQIEGDRVRVRQVLTNLLSNALKATKRGEVIVRVRAGDDGTVVTEVEDTGCGIEAAELPRLFGEYQQAGGVAARRQGSGLGLAICRRLVELHGGRITARSELGRGACFSATWRAATRAAERPEVAQ